MQVNYICYIRKGHLQIEAVAVAGGPKSDATLYACDPHCQQKVHFQHPGKRPYNEGSKEALAVAAHNAWRAAGHSDALYQEHGIDVLHGRRRNVTYDRILELVNRSTEPSTGLRM